jgi:hypothetical protein
MSIEAEMWEEFWIELDKTIRGRSLGVFSFNELTAMKTDIERRYLPERVAEIVGNFDVGRFHAAAFAAEHVRGDPEIEYMVREIRAALESGDLTKIKEWGSNDRLCQMSRLSRI